MSRNINYSQCWEDPDLLLKALKIKSSDLVLSITSGGDNTLALMLQRPKSIVSLDLNPAQNYLLELKLAAAQSLKYEEYLEFLGVRPSSNRVKYFKKIKLENEAKNWWEKHLNLIEKGVINTGRFEKFLNTFRSYILPLIHQKTITRQFISSPNLKEQVKFYQEKWNSFSWRLYFKLSSNRFILSKFARQKGLFKYVNSKNVAKIYNSRVDKNFQSVPLINNYFMHYCLTGEYQEYLPSYLQEKNFKLIRLSKTKLTLISLDIFSFLKPSPDNSFSKFNLSDIFEALSEAQFKAVWQEIIRTAKKGAIVVYWDNLLKREVPKKLGKFVKKDLLLSQQLFKKDRVFFYGGFNVYKIK